MNAAIGLGRRPTRTDWAGPSPAGPVTLVDLIVLHLLAVGVERADQGEELAERRVVTEPFQMIVQGVPLDPDHEAGRLLEASGRCRRTGSAGRPAGSPRPWRRPGGRRQRVSTRSSTGCTRRSRCGAPPRRVRRTKVASFGRLVIAGEQLVAPPGTATRRSAPSITSRSRSAWPLCRAYSSIMWVQHPADVARPARAAAGHLAAVGVGAEDPAGLGHTRVVGRPDLGDRLGVEVVEVAVRIVGGVVEGLSGWPSSQSANQPYSTSVRWRTSPSRDRSDGGTARRLSSVVVQPAHFISRVARWKSRNWPSSCELARVCRSGSVLGMVGAARASCWGMTASPIHRRPVTCGEKHQ